MEGGVRTGAGNCPEFGESGNPGPGPNSYFLYYIFVKALILIKFEHNAYNYVFYHIF